jgi:hypothetical protein
MPRRNKRVFLAMIPTSCLEKMDAALKTVFGEEAGRNFTAYLDTKYRGLFGQ